MVIILIITEFYLSDMLTVSPFTHAFLTPCHFLLIGELSISPMVGVLDFENIASYELLVKVVDRESSGLWSMAILYIEVIDVNDCEILSVMLSSASEDMGSDDDSNNNGVVEFGTRGGHVVVNGRNFGPTKYRFTTDFLHAGQSVEDIDNIVSINATLVTLLSNAASDSISSEGKTAGNSTSNSTAVHSSHQTSPLRNCTINRVGSLDNTQLLCDVPPGLGSGWHLQMTLSVLYPDGETHACRHDP